MDNIKLTEKEQQIIWRATKHKKKILGYGLPFRKMLTRILEEYNEELEMIEKELAQEEL